MTSAASRRRSASPVQFAFTSVLVSVAVLIAGLTSALAVRSAEATVGLGTADSFAVLAGSTITNTGSSTITGDIGLHPGTAFPGYDDGADSVTHLDGDLYISDAEGVALAAKNDLTTAYTNAAGRSVTETIGTELNGQVLTGGVYDSAAGTFGNSGTLTLDAEGVADTVWIFQMESALLASTGSTMVFVNGGDACNVFWQVGSSATLEAGSTFVGTIMALTSIWVGSGVTVDGRLLARNGEVTLITDTIARSDCAPIIQPTNAPSDAPPTNAPSDAPPTNAPSDAPPTNAPSDAPPANAPTRAPTVVPTGETALPDTATQQPPAESGGSSTILIVLLAAAVAGAGWLLFRPQVPVRVRVRRR